MAESYKAVARLKLSSKSEDGPAEYIERGESVSKSDVDDLDALVASGTVVTAKEFERLFPGRESGENQAPGTPSNLEQVKGTDLAAPDPDEDDSDSDEA